MYFVDETAIGARGIASGVTVHVVTGESGQMSLVRFEAGASLPMHSHPEEQMGIVLEGEFELIIGDEMRVLRAGDRYLIPGGLRHGVSRCEAGATAIDFFAPPRPEYR